MSEPGVGQCLAFRRDHRIGGPGSDAANADMLFYTSGTFVEVADGAVPAAAEG